MEWSWVYPGREEDRVPCCMVTEGGWTWFGSILLTLFLLVVFNLKYYRKVISKPKNLHKEGNERVLKDYLLSHHKGLGFQPTNYPLSIQDFKTAFQDRQKHPVIYKLEFSSGTSSSETNILSNMARTPVNLEKNRNPEVVPYDYNCVQVEGQYFNASLCTGYDDVNYIVTQGPLNNTLGDFWKMIWNENVSTIAMLTKTFDFIKVICVQYWPALGKKERYGSFYVKTVSEDQYANYVRRKLVVGRQIPRVGEESTRQIIQFQYTEWPCYGSPVMETLLDFCTRVKHSVDSSQRRGPCVVHCSDGGGRSGVYVLLEYNIRLIEREGLVDICSRFRKLRQERMGLVARENQYSLVYNLINRYVNSTLVRKNLKVQEFLHQRTNSDQIQSEYQFICSLVPSVGQGECAGAHRKDNRRKNRNVLLVPPDAHRPYITSIQGNTCTDYINAVFVDGFLKAKEFIVTEWPMNHTQTDFWSMIYDHEVSVIVLLDKTKFTNRFPCFWPELGKSLNFGPIFSVESIEVEKKSQAETWGETDEENRDFSIIDIQIRKREPVQLRDLQKLTGDQQNGQIPSLSSVVAGVATPPRQTTIFKTENPHGGLLNLLLGVKSFLEDKESVPTVCVVSQDGASRIGVYALLSYVKDQMDREGELNPVQAATTIKAHRPSLIKNVGEYIMFYQLLNQLINLHS